MSDIQQKYSTDVSQTYKDNFMITKRSHNKTEHSIWTDLHGHQLLHTSLELQITKKTLRITRYSEGQLLARLKLLRGAKSLKKNYYKKLPLISELKICFTVCKSLMAKYFQYHHHGYVIHKKQWCDCWNQWRSDRLTAPKVFKKSSSDNIVIKNSGGYNTSTTGKLSWRVTTTITRLQEYMQENMHNREKNTSNKHAMHNRQLLQWPNIVEYHCMSMQWLRLRYDSM